MWMTKEERLTIQIQVSNLLDYIKYSTYKWDNEQLNVIYDALCHYDTNIFKVVQDFEIIE